MHIVKKSVTMWSSLTCCLIAFESADVHATVLSDFEDGTQGWTMSLSLGGFGFELHHETNGGNPGGYIYGLDLVPEGGAMYAVAPSQFTGDLSPWAGVSWDAKYFPGVFTERAVNLTLLNADNAAFSFNPQIPTDYDWNTYFAPFDSSAWLQHGEPWTGTFADFLRDVSVLRFILEVSPLCEGVLGHSGREGGLDNVMLADRGEQIIPEPSTFIGWSLLGGLGVIGWWRRRCR